MKKDLIILSILRKNTKNFVRPLSEQVVAQYGSDPFLILISCLLSLRARDSMTIGVVHDLFCYVRTPEQLSKLDLRMLENIIKRIGFYKTKARTLKRVDSELLVRFGGRVPQTYEELVSIKGVGQKTANLVLGVAFGKPAICVDVHVHRISNRLGLVATKTPEETEAALQKRFDKKYWIELNTLLVLWGQNICTPIGPKCSVCVLAPSCKRVGVHKSR